MLSLAIHLNASVTFLLRVVEYLTCMRYKSLFKETIPYDEITHEHLHSDHRANTRLKDFECIIRLGDCFNNILWVLSIIYLCFKCNYFHALK